MRSALVLDTLTHPHSHAQLLGAGRAAEELRAGEQTGAALGRGAAPALRGRRALRRIKGAAATATCSLCRCRSLSLCVCVVATGAEPGTAREIVLR